VTRVLVTGGAGFIGSHACKALACQDIEPIAFDNLSLGHRGAARWGPLVEGDLCNSASIVDALVRFSPDAVMHFAAFAYVGESVSNPLRYYHNNVVSTINLLRAMLEKGVHSIVFSSSCTTYGIPDSVPISETAPLRPISPYGHSKLMGERIVRDTADAHALSYAILRYFNASGADPQGGLVERHDPETHLIPLIIDAAFERCPPLRVFGSDYPTPDGTCIRDYIHVSDLADAHVAAVKHLLKQGSSFTANLGSGRGASVRQVIEAVERIAHRHVPILWTDRRPGDPPALVADTSLATRLLGFRPQHSDLDTIIKTALLSRTSEMVSTGSSLLSFTQRRASVARVASGRRRL
jgi:UDP-arabinose 4-epimerase